MRVRVLDDVAQETGVWFGHVCRSKGRIQLDGDVRKPGESWDVLLVCPAHNCLFGEQVGDIVVRDHVVA